MSRISIAGHRGYESGRELPSIRSAAVEQEPASIFILSEIWVWWVQQMSELLITPFRHREATPATALIVVPDPANDSEITTISLISRRRRREHIVSHFPLDEPGLAALRRSLSRRGGRAPIVLRLSTDLLLERDVNLPLAAEQDVANALRYSIETLTPFAPAELFWNWTITSRDRLHRRLHLRLSLVCRASVEALVDRLQRAGAGPKLLEIPLSPAETRTIPLDSVPSRWDKLRRHAPLAVASFLAGVVVAIAVVPIAFRQRALTVTEAQIATLQPRVAEAEALRRRLADNADSIDVIHRERERVGDALQVIATITNALPDDTYLTELSLHQRTLLLTGESSAAARLIVVLSGETTLRNPRFVAPVTRAPMGGRDTFSIETEVVP